MSDKPRSKQKNITGEGQGVHKRGSGTGQGPVGKGQFMGDQGTSGGGFQSSQGSFGNGQSGSDGSGPNRSGGGGSLLKIAIIVIVLLLGGGGGLSTFLGGDSDYDSNTYTQTTNTTNTTNNIGQSSQNTSAGSGYGSFGSYSDLFNSVSGSSNGWSEAANTGKLNTTVASGARDRYTKVNGDGSDTVTIMVYMCGTDLESRSGMATNDLNEMLSATITNSNLNLIVFTGGCTAWRNNVVSSKVNQIYKISGGKMTQLESNAGTAAMTDPDNLSSFIKYCKTNYPANRNMLIFWDHGGGSLSGYGYDEKNPRSGSMTLAGINTALKNADLKFDFIGFDACLMATVETDIMLADYADYAIASEETEPGVGWYYTNWLSALNNDTSLSTLDIGKKIIDDFVDVCAKTCQGQKTTLSLVDLAELEITVPDSFKSFASSTTELIKNNEYKVVSDARSNVREFAQSSKIDQIDLVQFAQSIDTQESNELADALLSCVKYNRTSSNMTNAYGISIYFPYKKVSSVDAAVKTYDQIGLDDEYSDCIKEFASLEVAGQISTGGSTSPFGMLTGGGSNIYSGTETLETITQLISLFASGSSGISGLSDSNTDFFSGRELGVEEQAQYISENQFDASLLSWEVASDGSYYMPISQDQWSLVHSVELCMYYDDGTGYLDLGQDNLFEIDDDGNLIADTDFAWLSINGQPVAYHHLDTIEDGDEYTMTGYVPAMLNGEKVKLIIIHDSDNPNGYIAGAEPFYSEVVTETVSRGLIDLEEGDTLDFLCDFYSYDEEFQDSYYLGEQMTVTDDMTISYTYLGEDCIEAYMITDIYDQTYWTPVVGE
ncbi:MAG: peptidase C11 [Butyrivibrio sp.]|nr:peptidase C11 [Butyrivibrio sp.]